eukprot:tig00000523_g1853.t1
MCSFGSPSTRRTENGLVKTLCRELFVGCAIRKSVGNVIVQVARFALRVRLHFHQLRQSRRAGCTPAGYAGQRRERIPYTSGSRSGCRCGRRLRTGIACGRESWERLPAGGGSRPLPSVQAWAGAAAS